MLDGLLKHAEFGTEPRKVDKVVARTTHAFDPFTMDCGRDQPMNDLDGKGP